MATEMGPSIATAFWRLVSLSLSMSIQLTSVAPTLSDLNWHFPSYNDNGAIRDLSLEMCGLYSSAYTVRLQVSMCVLYSVFLSVFLSLCLCIYVCPSISPSICWCNCQSACMHVYTCVCQYVCVSVYAFVWLFVYACICMSIVMYVYHLYLYVYHYVCRSLYSRKTTAGPFGYFHISVLHVY